MNPSTDDLLCYPLKNCFKMFIFSVWNMFPVGLLPVFHVQHYNSLIFALERAFWHCQKATWWWIRKLTKNSWKKSPKNWRCGCCTKIETNREQALAEQWEQDSEPAVRWWAWAGFKTAIHYWWNIQNNWISATLFIYCKNKFEK